MSNVVKLNTAVYKTLNVVLSYAYLHIQSVTVLCI